MQKSETRQVAKTAHRQTMASTTLNRKYVKRPQSVKKTTTKEATSTDFAVRIKTSPKISRFGSLMSETTTTRSIEQVQPVEPHPTQILANQRLRERKEQTTQRQTAKLSAKELKDQAIKKALATASEIADEGTMAKAIAEEQKTATTKKTKMRFGFGRVMLALACAATAVFAIVYFVSLNMPDVQFRATAMQLNAVYPNYLPRDFGPTEIASENNIITLSFKNHNNEDMFSISEEKSSWDSNSLLNNYVKDNFGENYTVIREQGLTIYLNDNKAAWVNGGIVYKLNVKKGSLTKKQISSIAASL